MSSMVPPSFDIETTSVNAPTWVMTGWATLMVAGRLISRKFFGKKNSMGWDDALITVALATLLVGSSLISAAITALTQVDLTSPRETLPPAHALSFAANNTFLISVPLPKIVVAILLVRIFEPSRFTRIILFGGCILMLCIGLSLFAMNWASCSPVASQWNPWKYPHHTCWDPNVTLDYGYLFGALCVFQDFSLSIYPAFRLKKLRLSALKKFQLSLVLGLGFIGGIFAIVKTWELSQLRRETKDPAGPFNVSLHTALWNDIENSVAIICACVPTILPLTRLLRDKSIQSWTALSSMVRTGSGRSKNSNPPSEGSDRFGGSQSTLNDLEAQKTRQDSAITDPIVVE